MFFLLLFFSSLFAATVPPSALFFCCSFGEQCLDICAVSGGVDSNCFDNCHGYYCPVCDNVPPPSSSGLYDSDSLSFAAVVQSLDVLSYIIISVCVLFSFLLGYSGGRK